MLHRDQGQPDKGLDDLTILDNRRSSLDHRRTHESSALHASAIRPSGICPNPQHVLFAVLLLAIPLSDAPIRAHDLWLVPDSPASVKRPNSVQVSSGTEFPKSEHIPDPAGFRRRLLVTPDGTRQEIRSTGKDSQAGLLRFTPDEDGIHIVAVETQPKLISLDAAKFNEYLISDGLSQIYALRSREGTLDQPARERYRKSPKALVRVGNELRGDPCQIVGLPLEIVPCRNPFELEPGDTLRVRVLFHNQPLAEANLGWDLPGDGEAPSGTVRSDSAGEALVPVARTGLMTIRLTHMTRPRTDDFEWESFWTTLTFHVPGADE
jgi:uncharacterized GH25 family protein